MEQGSYIPSAKCNDFFKVGRIQNLIQERTMFIPLTDTNSPAALGPRVKGNPYKIQPLIWFTAPFEDMELTN